MVTNTPRVCVIVLTWNNLADTLDCLHSLQKLEYPNFRVLLVDNGSTDNTVPTVRVQFPDVHIIENGCNLGYAEGNNVGIRYALESNADYVFLLNNDASVEPNCVSSLVDVAQSDSEIGMLGPTIISSVNPAKTYMGGHIYWSIAAGEEIECSSDGLHECLDVDYVPGCALLVKAEVIRRIGPLDPRFFAYFEDADWSVRCRHASYRVVVVPQANVYHKGSMDQSESKSPTAEFYFRRNQFLFMREYAKWYFWFPFFKHNIRKTLERFERLAEKGQSQHAEALLDGWWAGVTGKYGAAQVKAPVWFKTFIQTRLPLLMWLTGWLYFVDYHKAKRDKSREQLKLNRANRPLP